MNNNISPFVDIRCISFFIAFAFMTLMPVQLQAHATCNGGKHHLKDFLAEHLVYPRDELARGKDGSVSLSFDINSEGLPQQVKILQSSGPAFSGEASRLFRLLVWEPASIHRKNSFGPEAKSSNAPQINQPQGLIK